MITTRINVVLICRLSFSLMDGVVVGWFKPQNPQTFKQSSGGWKRPASGPLVEDLGNVLGRLIIISCYFSSGCRCRTAQRLLSLWDGICALKRVPLPSCTQRFQRKHCTCWAQSGWFFQLLDVQRHRLFRNSFNSRIITSRWYFIT